MTKPPPKGGLRRKAQDEQLMLQPCASHIAMGKTGVLHRLGWARQREKPASFTGAVAGIGPKTPTSIAGISPSMWLVGAPVPRTHLSWRPAARRMHPAYRSPHQPTVGRKRPAAGRVPLVPAPPPAVSRRPRRGWAGQNMGNQPGGWCHLEPRWHRRCRSGITGTQCLPNSTGQSPPTPSPGRAAAPTAESRNAT